MRSFSQQELEKWLDHLLVKQLPPLPASGKKALVQYLPWVNLVLGLLSAGFAYAIWHWAHLANSLINATNPGTVYGGPAAVTNHLSTGIWLGIGLLAVEAVLYLVAFPMTRELKKTGWNLMFYALLINLAYGILILFTSYGTIGTLFSSVLGSVIGLYLVFQIRPSYSNSRIRR